MKLLKLFNILICATAWVGGIVTTLVGFASGASGAAAMAFLPFLYGFFSTMLFLCCRVWESENRFTTYAVLVLQWVRCVFLPALGMISGAYAETMASEHFSTAIWLQILETVVTSLFFLFLLRKEIKAPKIGETALVLHGNYCMYILLGIGALVLYLMFARGEKLFSFIFLNLEERVGDKTESSHVMIRTVVSAAIAFLALCFIYRNYEKFTATKRKRYVYIATLVACFMLCIIVGERRSRQLYLLFAYSMLLCSLFPKYKKRMLFSLLAVGGTVLVIMSIYKFFNAFLYDSYGEAIAKANSSMAETVATYDSYFYGLKVLERNLSYNAYANLPLKQILFDLGRSTFGIHYFFKGGHGTSELYNLYIYGGAQSSGNMMSAVGYWYMFFGYAAPLMSIINLFAAVFLERSLNKARSIEWLYTLSVVYMRVAFGVFGYFAPLLNSGTQTLVINGLVIFCAGMFRSRRRRQSIYRR